MHRINTNWCSVQSPQVKRHPGDYEWIYDPDTFRVEKWGTESIDDLVKEIRPSRETVEYLSKSYEDDDQKAKKEKWNRMLNRIGRTIKSTPKRLQNWLAEYDKLIIGLGGLIIGAIAASFTILTYLK